MFLFNNKVFCIQIPNRIFFPGKFAMLGSLGIITLVIPQLSGVLIKQAELEIGFWVLPPPHSKRETPQILKHASKGGNKQVMVSKLAHEQH